MAVSFDITKVVILYVLQPAKRSGPLILTGRDFDQMYEIKSRPAKNRPPLMEEEAWKRMEGEIGLAPWSRPMVTWALELEGRGLAFMALDKFRPDLVQRPSFGLFRHFNPRQSIWRVSR
jgi:hypothetical protein